MFKVGSVRQEERHWKLAVGEGMWKFISFINVFTLIFRNFVENYRYMKNKIGLIATAILVLLMIVMSQGVPLKAQNQDKPKTVEVKSIPDSIMKIFNNSCISCHSKGGNFVAEAKLNFSKWDKYKAKKQARLSKDICRMLSKDAMPPKSARESKPETVPSKEQMKSICYWGAGLNKKK